MKQKPPDLAIFLTNLIKGGINLGFWDDERCEYCNGSINILKTIESSICGRRKAESEISMAVYSL